MNFEIEVYRITRNNGTINEENVVSEQEIVVSHDVATVSFRVECDKIEDNNSFTMDYYGDNGIEVSRNRCYLDVHLLPNVTPFDKIYTVVCTHSNDVEKYVIISIIQQAEEFKIEAKIKTGNSGKVIKLKSRKKKEGNNNVKYDGGMYYEEVEIPVIVKGGSEKFRILSVMHHHPETDSSYIIKDFNIRRDNNNNIVIKNYGRQNMDINDYYIVKIQHYDKRDVTDEFRITYHNNCGKSTEIEEDDTGYSSQSSEVYKEFESGSGGTTVEVNTKYKIIIKDGNQTLIDGDEIALNDLNDKKTLTYKVQSIEGEKCNDCKIRVKPSAYWCDAKVVDTKNIDISINNKPLIDRKSQILVNVLGTDTKFKFYVKNKATNN